MRRVHICRVAPPRARRAWRARHGRAAGVARVRHGHAGPRYDRTVADGDHRTLWGLAIATAPAAVATWFFWVGGDLPLVARVAAYLIGGLFACVAAAFLVFLVQGLTRPPPDPRANRGPTGGQPVWLEDLGDGSTIHPDYPKGPVITIGAATAASDVRDAAAARIRIWPDVVDVARTGVGPVRVDGVRLGRHAWRTLDDGAVIEVGGRRLRVAIGWAPDPADPRVGARVAGVRLLRRLGATPRGTRYAIRDGVLERLERCEVTDDALAAHAAAAADLSRCCAAIAPVAGTGRDADGTPVVWWRAAPTPATAPTTPERVRWLCEALASLHRAGRAHGALAPSNLIALAEGGTGFVAALPTTARTPGDGPYREGVPPGDDDAAFLAPEVRDGAAATPATDVHALATFLARALTRPPHVPQAPAWASLLDAARGDDPAARPADAHALAVEIVRAAVRTAPGAPFDGRTLTGCDGCGEALVEHEQGPRIMFDGVGPDGRATGGYVDSFSTRCLGCGRQTHREEVTRY